jgi:hypothetical protein
MGLFVEKKNIQPIVKLGSLPLTTNWCYFGNDDWQVSCIFYRLSVIWSFGGDISRQLMFL